MASLMRSSKFIVCGMAAGLTLYSYVKSQVSSKGIQVSISEMQYGYTVQGDAQVVLNAEDVIHARESTFRGSFAVNMLTTLQMS